MSTALSTLSLLSSRLRVAFRGIFAGENSPYHADSPPIDLLEHNGLHAQCHRAWPADPAFDTAWERLLASSPLATTFHSPTWHRDGIGPTLRPGTLRLLTVMRGGQLLAILPLQFTGDGFFDSAGFAVSDYLDPLADQSADDEAWRPLFILLRRLWNRNIRAITLRNVRPEASCRAILPSLAQEEGFICEQRIDGNAARLRLPDSWDAYLDSLDPHERKELRRKIRKAESHAGALLQTITADNFSASHLASAMDLIEAAGDEKRAWLRDNVRPLLMRIGATLIAEGRMALHFLLLHDRPAACMIEFPSAQGPLLYNSGFDPAQRHWSPGAVTFGLAIQNAIARGARTFDLMRGREPYKYRLGALDEPLYRITLRR